MRGRRWLALAAVAAAGAALSAGTLARLYVDWLWYGEVGYRRVWATALLAPYAVGLPAGVLAAALWYASTRRAVAAVGLSAGWRVGAPWLRWRVLQAGLRAAALVPGLAVGGLVASAWPAVLLHLHRVPFGVADPLFGRDAAFYVFSLPVYRVLLQAASLLLVLCLLAAAAAYALGGAVYAAAGRLAVEPVARRHLALLAAGLLLAKAASYLLAAYALLARPSGAVFGAGFTDVHVRLPALRLLTALAAGGAAAAVWAGYRRDLRGLYAALAGLAAVSLLAGGLAGLVQRLVVEPNELARERPYLEHAIRFTRYAFDLEDIRVLPYSMGPPLAEPDLAAHADTFANVRLWDPRPLLVLLNQVQTIRPYYVFADVDVDRYRLDGRLRQVLLAVRELDSELLNEAARTWVNVHLKYTHGYGLVAASASEATPGGQPRLPVRDIPPQAEASRLRVARPEIYFGERTSAYAIVNTREDEFDYPQGDRNAFARYAGKGGIPAGGALRRLALAIYLRSHNVLVSTALRPDSRVLLHRRVVDRLARVAPFLVWDRDPYPVIRPDGRVVWVADGYTVARGFPYAEPYQGDYARNPGLQGANYVRNAVKAVVDAYDGTVALYAVAADDPVLAALQRAFPGVFRPASELPDDLRPHLRYPEDLFRVQAEMYGRYHMTDPAVFYNREDVWAVAQEVSRGAAEPMEPYYLLLRLPGEREPELVLLLPFTPQRRENLIAFLVARNDPPRYGQRIAYTLPKQQLVYGPMQVENRINQDPAIARDLALWNQRGVEVLRGNLLVIPVERSLVYVEPLFLQAEQRGLPELKRVIVAHGDRVVMAERLTDALRLVAGAAAAPEEGIPPGPAPPAGDELAALIEEAARLYDEAEAALRAGDFAAYGERIRRLGAVLAELRRRTVSEGR